MFDWFRRKQAAPAGRKMTSADLADLLRCGPLSFAGAPVTPERAMRVATVYACVRILAESVAQLPCKIYRRDETGREQVESGPLFDLMHFPNPWQNSFEFREHLMACLCLRGNFFALMSRRRGEVIELLPLRPEAVSVQRRNWELLYTYTDANGRSATVGADKMLHVRGLSLDGIMGVSPIRYGRDAIGLAMATEKHGALMFRNGARPGGVLKHPAKLSDEALEHLKISWEAAHGGENSGRTAILEEGMSYESVSMTNEDAQYLDTRQFQRNEICALFRVPPHMVGDLTKSSFSNITQQSLEFVKYSVLPWCRRIETAFWRSLLTDEQRREGYRIEFLVDGLERADIKTRYESYSIAIQNGILSPNECRRLENRNPREGGDVFLQPLNMTDGTKAGDADEDAGESGKSSECMFTTTLMVPSFKELLESASSKAASPGGPMAPDAGAGKPTAGGDEPGDASLAHIAAIVGAMEAQAFQHQDEIGRIMAAGKAATSKGPSSGWGSAEGADLGKGASGQGPAGSEAPPTPPVRFAASPAFSFGHRTASHALGKAKEGALECRCAETKADPACHAEERSDEASPEECRRAPQEILRGCAPQNDSLEAKAEPEHNEDGEPEHDDWADAEWSPEAERINAGLRKARMSLRKGWAEVVALDVREAGKLVDRYFPDDGKSAKAGVGEFGAALEALYRNLRPEMEGKLERLYHDLAQDAIAAAARQAGFGSADFAGSILDTVTAYTGYEVADYTASSLAQLRALAGEDKPAPVRARLKERLERWNATRPKKMGDVAAVHATNWYVHETYKKCGVTKMRWVAQGAKTCGFCSALNGTIVGISELFVPKGGKVSGNGATLITRRKIKHPPIHLGCVCVILPAFDPIAGVEKGLPMTPEAVADADGINPGFVKDGGDPGRRDNCSACAIAVEAIFRGMLSKRCRGQKMRQSICLPVTCIKRGLTRTREKLHRDSYRLEARTLRNFSHTFKKTWGMERGALYGFNGAWGPERIISIFSKTQMV